LRFALISSLKANARIGAGRIVGMRIVTAICFAAAMELEAYELVILRWPSSRPDFDDETAQRLQQEHLDFHTALRDAGHIVTNGPLLDQPDESVRGLTFYRTGSLQEAKLLAEQDPLVKAGGLVIDVMTWWCPAGSMVKPGRPVSHH
jgi:uncharacterized protein YciI